MKNFHQSKIFWFSAAVIFIAIFLFLSNTSQGFRSQKTIILLPQNTTISTNMEGVMQNAEELIKRQISQTPGASFQRLGKSQMMEISAKGATRQEAENLAERASQTFISEMGRHYNIKTELSARIIAEESKAGSFSPQSAIYNFFASIILSLILALAFFNIFDSFSSSKTSVKKMPAFSLAGLSRNLNGFTEEKKNAEKKSEIVFTEKTETKTVVPPTTFSRKSAAPENLPFADEEIVEQVLYANGNGNGNGKKKEEKIIEETKKEPEKPKEDIFREATPEEVKERLNKLLSGKM